MTKKLKITSVSILLLLIAALVGFTGCGSQVKTVTESQIADLNRPAEVYVVTSHEADVTVPVLTYNIDALVNAVVAQILAGQAGRSETAIEDALINELIARAQLYIIPSAQKETKSLSVSASGNGFIISSDGFIVTNAHIVKASDKDLQEEFAIEVIADQLVTELPIIEEKLGFELQEDDIDKFFEAAAAIIADKVTISDPTSKTQVYTGNIIDKARKEENGLTAEMVRVGDPLDLKKETGKDVAVLKVNASELPTVKLGDESSVRDGDRITSVTFISSKAEEGAGTSEVPKEDTPSLVTGTISGLRKMSDGWNVLQMQIPLKPGASGSPIYNSNGEVVGMETFVSMETQADTGQQTPVETQNYAIPISVIKEFMSLANVSSAEGTAGKAYRQGVDLFSENHYSAAKKKFEDVRNTNPDFPYIQNIITESQNNINKGLDKGTFPTALVLILLLIVIVIIVVVLILFLVIMPRSRRKKGGGGGMGGPGMMGGPGPGGPGPPYGPGMGPGGPGAPGPMPGGPGAPGTQPPPPGPAAPGGPPPAGPGPAAPGGAPPSMPGSPGDTGK